MLLGTVYVLGHSVPRAQACPWGHACASCLGLLPNDQDNPVVAEKLRFQNTPEPPLGLTPLFNDCAATLYAVGKKSSWVFLHEVNHQLKTQVFILAAQVRRQFPKLLAFLDSCKGYE